jgi:sugar phosphate isomerase/epimerase
MRKIAKTSMLMTICAFMAFGLNAKPAKKEIGLQLWSVKDDIKKDVPGTIAAVGEMGYTFVETAGYGDGKFYGMDPLEFKALVNENGMEFLSSHTGQALPDADKWDETMAWWDVCIDAHAKAGVKYIVQPFMDEKGYGSLEDLQRYCDYFNAVGEKCNAKGIRFGYHNHNHEFEEVDGKIRYDYMLQNTDPKKVFFQLDLYWIVVGGQDPVAYFNKYPKRFDLLHIKDKEELGASGMMDFESMFAAKKKAGTKHIIVEVERYNFPPLESVEKSLEFLMEADYVK